MYIKVIFLFFVSTINFDCSFELQINKELNTYIKFMNNSAHSNIKFTVERENKIFPDLT